MTPWRLFTEKCMYHVSLIERGVHVLIKSSLQIVKWVLFCHCEAIEKTFFPLILNNSINHVRIELYEAGEGGGSHNIARLANTANQTKRKDDSVLTFFIFLENYEYTIACGTVFSMGVGKRKA